MVASISSAVAWWEEWQLRILVLGSLAVQLYLAVVAPLRKVTGLINLTRLLIWVSYLGGDALAIYALATLFNRRKRLTTVMDGSRDLEVFWAPILLIHLGGRLTISAYNMEDNELWLRHLGVAISQVTVAVYVFWTTWSPSADKRLLAAAVLLFILGTARCFERPLALKRASFNNLATYFVPSRRTEIATTPSREVELERFIQDAKACYVQQQPTRMEEGEKWPPLVNKMLYRPNKLFVDYAYAYRDRIEKLKSLRQQPDPESVFMALSGGLSKTFDLVYTRIWRQGLDETWGYVSLLFGDLLSILVLAITGTLPIASIVLFHMSRKQAYRGSDVKVTYLLLYVTHISDLISGPSRLQISRITAWWPWNWSMRSVALVVARRFLCLPSFHFVRVDQHSLIGVFADKKEAIVTATVGHALQCCCGTQDLLHQRWFGRRRLFHRAKDITGLIIAHAEDAWLNRIEDVESYWKLSDSRGHWTLERNGCQKLSIIYDSLEKPLDESIILWHMATDLCYHCNGASADPELASVCRVISNYMMYLLSANTEMLLPGSRASLFKDACTELDDILLKGDGDDRHLQLTERFISKAAKSSQNGFLNDAWLLAQGLMQLPASGGDGKKMWSVIKGVWLEMLCFSACRCRGFMHAKNLAYGGEFLTYVAILLSTAGLETFADKQRRMQLRLSKEERLKQAMEIPVDIQVV